MRPLILSSRNRELVLLPLFASSSQVLKMVEDGSSSYAQCVFQMVGMGRRTIRYFQSGT